MPYMAISWIAELCCAQQEKGMSYKFICMHVMHVHINYSNFISPFSNVFIHLPRPLAPSTRCDHTFNIPRLAVRNA